MGFMKQPDGIGGVETQASYLIVTERAARSVTTAPLTGRC
jgi:hypothetical protein